MEVLYDFIIGRRTIAKQAHFDCSNFFKDNGYKQIIPGCGEDAPR
jgi:hypothetical protein